jgi:hypothetical protein
MKSAFKESRPDYGVPKEMDAFMWEVDPDEQQPEPTTKPSAYDSDEDVEDVPMTTVKVKAKTGLAKEMDDAAAILEKAGVDSDIAGVFGDPKKAGKLEADLKEPGYETSQRRGRERIAQYKQRNGKSPSPKSKSIIMSQEHQAGAKMSFTPARQKEEILKTAKSMRPDLTPEQLTELGKLYDKGARDQKMLSEIEKQSGSSMLGVAGVGADVFKEGIYNPASDMIGKVVGVPLNLATKVPVAGEYLEAGLHNLGKAMNAGEDWIGGKVAHITGSQTFADVTKELLMQATLAGVIGGAGKAVKAYTSAVKVDVQAMFQGVRVMEVESTLYKANAGTPWDSVPVKRGQIIEKDLGQNLPQSFKTIDRFTPDGVATSIKSVDLSLKTCQNPKTFQSLLEGYVDDVARFTEGRLNGVIIRPTQITGRALDLAIPYNWNTAQQTVIQSVSEYATSRGVQFNLIIMK